ncbi:MAG: MBL fold metallo-hydrolase, partial [Lentisphaerae bacterium]|nr:MBL fold metallo-hydrolase [Lentisphaerota bacterium]
HNMVIEILGAESLGVRGLCCLVTTGDRRILIDPGVALGYRRGGLPPHPIQIAAGEDVRKAIVNRLAHVTDVVISHFHGDHMPLTDANPYQLAMDSVKDLLRKPQLWMKQKDGDASLISNRRDLFLAALERSASPCNGQTHGLLSFSELMPHGLEHNPMGTVIMTRIQEGNEVFVHASDIQLLSEAPIAQIIKWSPTILFASGPAVYRGLPRDELQKAHDRAMELARNINVCILDHHLLRCSEGVQWLNDLQAETDGRIMCAADFMKKRRRFLESERAELYKQFPVPDEWHKQYASGKVTTIEFRNLNA